MSRAPRRVRRLAVGLVLYAASVAALVHSGLGNMPWDVLSQGLARQVGWTLGAATLVLSAAVLLCWIPLRQRPGAGTVANVLVIGLLIDPFMALLALLPDPLPLGAAIALAAGGIGLNGLATALYIGARMGPGPRDGLMTGLVSRTGGPVRVIRAAIEVTVVLGGWLLGGTVGPGTLAYALVIGPLAHVLMPRFDLAPTGAGPAGAVSPTPDAGGAGVGRAGSGVEVELQV